jgi:hypothetical protein
MEILKIFEWNLYDFMYEYFLLLNPQNKSFSIIY